METPDFDVVISGVHVNPEAWRKAVDATRVELSREQKEAARKMGVADEDYARGLVASQLGEEFQRGRGKVLGKRIKEILESLGQEYTLTAVVRQGTEFRWIARIEAAEKTVAVALPLDLVDDLVDSGAAQEVERLRNLVLFGVGRQELISKH